VKAGKIELPALPGRTVLSAQLLNGEKVDFQQDGKTLTVTVPQASPVSIVELNFDQSVDGIPAISDGAALSIFNDVSTYGKIVSRTAEVKTSSTSPFFEIDLGSVVSVTGVRVLNGTKSDQHGTNHTATLRLSISSDGKTWTEVWKTEKILPQWEVPVNNFVAGAEVPGRQARYLRLETKSEKPEPLNLKEVEVYGFQDQKTAH
jgi:hypothetical protein